MKIVHIKLLTPQNSQLLVLKLVAVCIVPHGNFSKIGIEQIFVYSLTVHKLRT